MMILDDLQEIIDTSEFPNSFPDDMNIGTGVDDDDFEYAKIFEYFRRTRQTLWGGRTDASPKLLLYDT